MIRYFFDLKVDGEDPTYDEEGTLHPNLAMAQVEATRTLGDLFKEMMMQSGRDANSLAVIIRDGNGPLLQATVHFAMTRLRPPRWAASPIPSDENVSPGCGASLGSSGS
jgi:hypothetical protein